ncbi:hypothetical protein [Aquisphaera giovannonii]|nr:hypothetical protein [Aquisphaera giovannonii]
MGARPHPGRRARGAILAAALSAAWSLASPAPAQTLAPSQPIQAGPPAGDAEALSVRYLFQEKYTEDPTKAGVLLNLYRVAVRETIQVKRDNPEGAPTVGETSLRSIYTERVTRTTKDKVADEVLRNYDSATFKTTDATLSPKVPPLAGMRIVYRLRGPDLPVILCLTSRRRMTHMEFRQISDQIYLPTLTLMLPRQPARAGDTWPMSIKAAWALLGSIPNDQEYDLNVELAEVKKGQGSSMVAVFAVRGTCTVTQGPSAINARVEFTFEPSKPAGNPATAPLPVAGGASAREGVFEARGYISRISLAQNLTFEVPESEGRLMSHTHREVVLERRKDGQQLEPQVPSPEADVDNSWLVFDDPGGRYHLLFPQELDILHVNAQGVDFASRQMDRQDMVRLRLIEKSGDPTRDRLAADPMREKQRLEAQWSQRGEKILPGSAGWLPEADWATFKRKVWRYEAALIPDDQAGGPQADRIYLDDYIVQFPRNETLQLDAMTTRQPHTKFRQDVEDMIRNFELGPPGNALPAAPRQPAPRP